MPIVAEYRPVRAPRAHGECLVHPSWEQVGELLAENLATRTHWDDYDVQGQSLDELSRHARRALLTDAIRYTRAYRDIAQAAGDDIPILLAGHQPQLFHPGVWFKNFALSSLGNVHRAHAVNLLIDNDIHRLPSLRVPAGSADRRHLSAVTFDQLAEPIPYEERLILDPETFTSFGRRVEEAIGDLVPDPLIGQLWPLAIEAAGRSPNLGRCLGEARHRLEARWGQQTLELPLSAVCKTPSFARFATHLLAHLPRLQDVYNTSLAEYRQVNRIRSRSHPVPDLAIDGDWLEAPFWIWTAQQPHRRRMFVRARGDELEVSDRAAVRFSLTLSADCDGESAVAQFLDQAPRGVRLRPRALMTTMYARMVLSDLFLHGIGGGKYDQLTDLIIRRFMGLHPPHYLMISATALLFQDRTPELRRQLRESRELLRDLRFHPERHVLSSDELSRLVDEKRAWIHRELPPGHRKERHRAIEHINAALQEHLAVSTDEAATRVEETAAALRQETRFASREFAFCLFPEATLRPLLLDLARTEA